MNDIPSILFVAAIITVLVGLFAFGFFQNKKRKEASWTGTVLDKSMQENVRTGDSSRMNDDRGGVSVNGISFGSNRSEVAVTHSYSITVRPDGVGEPFDWPISSGFYETVKIGDKLVKRPGTTTPEIVSSASAASSDPVAAAQPQGK